MRIRYSEASTHIVNELNRRSQEINATTERLSSGKKINRAADDAAGLAISQKLLMQIKGSNQAQKNSLDGISLIQTAEGGINGILEMLQRGRTLAIQAANDTLTLSDRQIIQREISALVSETDRQTSTVEFNTLKLLDGQAKEQPTLITSQSDFQRGTSSQSMGVDEIDMSTSAGIIQLATEPFQVDAAHTNIGAEDYISVERIAVTPNGNQYDVTLEVKFSATGGANGYDGSVTINNGNITGVGALAGNEGGAGLVQMGNTVNFNITENGDADESIFTINFTTTSLDAGFSLNLNTPVNENINTYFDNSVIRNGVPPYNVTRRFEPLFISGTYTSEVIDLGKTRKISIDSTETKPANTNIIYQVETSNAPSGPFSSPVTINNGATFTANDRYIRINAIFSTPATLAANGIGPSISSIQVTPRGKSLTLHIDSDRNEVLEISLPDLRTAELGINDIDVTRKAGDIIFGQTITSQADFEAGSLSNASTTLNPGSIELDINPWGTEAAHANTNGERYISVSRNSVVANPNGTYTSNIRVVSGSDGIVPYDSPPPGTADGSTRFSGRFSIIGGTINDINGDFNPDGETLTEISMEGYPPHTADVNYLDDITNGDPGSTISADQFVDFRFRTGGLQDGFDITFTANPDASFRLSNLDIQDFAAAGTNANVHFGDGNIISIASTGSVITQQFETRVAGGTYESKLLDLGEGGTIQVSWNGTTPGATGIAMEYRTSADGMTFSSYQPITNGGRFTSSDDQRFVQVRATLTGDGGNSYLTPRIDDISVNRITPATGAEKAIDEFSQAIDDITGILADLGSKQNRLGHIIKQLMNKNETHSYANSRILDADIAEETVAYTRRTILQQVAVPLITIVASRRRSILTLLR